MKKVQAASTRIEVPRSLTHLPRAPSLFEAIKQDLHITVRLPPDGVTSGKILLSASNTVEQLLEKNKPMKFMFGFTHDPIFRYHNARYGYKRGRNSFNHMVVLYVAAESIGPSFLEAILIDKYGSFLNSLWFPALVFFTFVSCSCVGKTPKNNASNARARLQRSKVCKAATTSAWVGTRYLKEIMR